MLVGEKAATVLSMRSNGCHAVPDTVNDILLDFFRDFCSRFPHQVYFYILRTASTATRCARYDDFCEEMFFSHLV